jgi:hypothetical protein
VIDLAHSPRTCVRFNRHAVYLGVPSASQNCPAHAVGRTGAILVEPLTAGVAGAAGDGSARGAAVRGAQSATSFVVPKDGVSVTATWSGDRGIVSGILRRPVAGSRPAAAPQARASHATRRPSGSFRPMEATFAGLGFDACQAPPATTMNAWGSSPFRAIGVYIGGANAACSQPNLTAAWVSAEVAAGWHLIPTYVGYQGAGACGGSCAPIIPGQAGQQGTAAAVDAVNQAQALGIPAGNPIYYDMEQYTETSANRFAVLAFLAAWTSELHAQGYVSGVYSSASSGISDLAAAYGTGYTEPDDIWIGHWNNQQTTTDSYVPTVDWANNQRLHQYRGDHYSTYGGVTLDIDSDYLGGATADTYPPIPNGTFVQVTGQPEYYVIAGGAPLFVNNWYAPSGTPIDQITPQQFALLPPHPANGTFVTTTTGLVYRIAGGSPVQVTNWAIYGAQQTSVEVDEWDLQNETNPLARLSPAPADGTVVEGLPSQTYWSFCGGTRSPGTGTLGAVQVDDQGLAAFATGVPTGGVGSGSGGAGSSCGTPQPRVIAAVQCVVPRLKHESLVQTRASLRTAHCRLGHVRRPHHWPRNHLLHVFGQSSPVHSTHPAGYKVNIWLI